MTVTIPLFCQVFWDRIKCGGSDTCGFLFGPEVKALLPNAIIKKVETKQVRAVGVLQASSWDRAFFPMTFVIVWDEK